MILKLMVLWGFLLSGCALLQETPTTSVPSTSKQPPVVKEVKAPVVHKKGGVWELLGTEQITLQFKNVDTGMNLSVVIQDGVSVHPVTPGHWELTGFEEKGRSYTSMNVSKKFVMRIRPNTLTYAGSVLVGCPKIETTNFKLLKSMKFFNRYPFSSGTGLCEMIIGNDLVSVRNSLRHDRKSKTLNLVMGF